MMRITEIKTDEDLERAFDRFDEIWSARPGDDDWNERSQLADLIEEYEDKHVQIPAPDPVDAERFRMEQARPRYRDSRDCRCWDDS